MKEEKKFNFLTIFLFCFFFLFVSFFSLFIALYFHSHPKQNYRERDAGKVVLYSTSMGIVRETYAKCANVKQILRTLLVKFEERDIFMSSDYQQEIKDRMQSLEIQVPQLFVDGQHIGVSIGAEIGVRLPLSRIVFVHILMDAILMMTLCRFSLSVEDN